MIRVLDLFAGTQSVRKALKEQYNINHFHRFNNGNIIIYRGFKELKGEHSEEDIIVEYVGVDIYSPEYENIILDLTQDNIVDKLKEKLGDWKPDFIWASPICNYFSTAINAKGGGNFYFEIGKDKIPYPRKNWDINIRHYMEKYLVVEEDGTTPAYKRAIMALEMIENTYKIIEYFKVPYAIENPAHNYAKPIYISKGAIINTAAYCNYGFEVRKYTNIYTNREIDLKGKCNHNFHKYTMGKKVSPEQISYSGYAKRSKVPPLLIKDIIKQLTERRKNG